MVQKAISDYIFDTPIIPKARLFSSEAEIDTFFSVLPSKAINSWPLDLSDKKLHTKYLSARVVNSNWKIDPYFIVQAEISDDYNKAIVEEQISFGPDDNLIVKINSLYSPVSDNNHAKMTIAHTLSEKNFDFILNYDKAIKPAQPSYIKIHASSELTKQNIRTNGGYVWANNGFDFADKNDLKSMRKIFKSFLSKHGVSISDKQLQLFTKPCHFAAYGCGILAEVNNKKCYLGKAFLLQTSWMGILKSSAKNSIERKYSQAYYGEKIHALRRKKAIQKLSKKYREFLKHSYKKALLTKVSQRFKAYKRLLAIKLSKFRN